MTGLDIFAAAYFAARTFVAIDAATVGTDSACGAALDIDPFSASACIGLARLGGAAAAAFAAGCAEMIANTAGIFGDGCIASHAFGGAVFAEREDTASVCVRLAVHRAVSLADAVSSDGASMRTDGRRRFACAIFAGLVGSAGCEVNPFSASAAVGLALLGTAAATAFAT